MRARIVERTRQNGTKNYWIQKRFLFWWFDFDEYNSLAEAQKKMCFYDGTRVVDRVVGEDSQRKPDPEVSVLTHKLKTAFEDRLKAEDNPEDFLNGLNPYVFHEFKHYIPDIVNEAQGKLYVIDSPIHGGKAIVLDGDFAQKVLTLGLP